MLTLMIGNVYKPFAKKQNVVYSNPVYTGVLLFSYKVIMTKKNCFVSLYLRKDFRKSNGSERGES